jgi:hypothetical protein
MLLKGFVCIGAAVCAMFADDVPDDWTAHQCLRNGQVLVGMRTASLPFTAAETSHSFGCTRDGVVVAATYAIQPGLHGRDQRDLEARIAVMWRGHLDPAADRLTAD